MRCYEEIVRTIKEILVERGDAVPELIPETRIRASGMDSLDIAALVVRLEERLGFDPFAEESPAQYPQTLGQLAELYERTAQRKP